MNYIQQINMGKKQKQKEEDNCDLQETASDSA